MADEIQCNNCGRTNASIAYEQRVGWVCKGCNTVLDPQPAVPDHQPPVLSQEAQDAYIKSGGLACPFCHSSDISGGSIEVEAGCCWQPIDCSECGAEWQDVYSLVSIESQHGEPFATELYKAVPPEEDPMQIANTALGRKITGAEPYGVDMLPEPNPCD